MFDLYSYSCKICDKENNTLKKKQKKLVLNNIDLRKPIGVPFTRLKHTLLDFKRLLDKEYRVYAEDHCRFQEVN